MTNADSIVALATPTGTGAIAVIRISGSLAITIVDQVFQPVKKIPLASAASHTVHLGYINGDGTVIDQVLATVFIAPNSYTGEHVVEISCHGSLFIQQQILQTLIAQGARAAQPGEFTQRAFLHGKIDLAQAEAVADLIAAENLASHQLALQQMRGGFSAELKRLREQLLHFASMIELELDFSEEDVAFADREEFANLLQHIETVLVRLLDSFATGNVIKQGVPIAIAGEPNVGKSTLLNTLLNEERAIVSHIAGTTRDTVEDTLTIGGIGFRFIDTAGIRETTDVIEQMGISRTFEKMQQAAMMLYLVDLSAAQDAFATLTGKINTEMAQLTANYPNKKCLLIGNKADLLPRDIINQLQAAFPTLLIISAKEQTGIDTLRSKLLKVVQDQVGTADTTITNARHFNALQLALAEIKKVQKGLAEQLTTDLLAIDLRQALYHFGEITGQVTNDELLGNIFGKFCIGK